MVTVVVGQTFSGELTPTPSTAPHPASHRTSGPARTRRCRSFGAAAWKLGFLLQIPTVIERSSVIDSGAVPGLQDGRPQDGALHLQDGGERVLGIQQTDWDDAPALSDKNRSVVIKGQVRPLLQRVSPHMIALRAGERATGS